MGTTLFYNAVCPECVTTEKQLSDALDPQWYKVKIVHLGESKDRITEAETFGVKSMPALVMDGPECADRSPIGACVRLPWQLIP